MFGVREGSGDCRATMEVLVGLLIYVRSSRNSMVQSLELHPISVSRFA